MIPELSPVRMSCPEHMKLLEIGSQVMRCPMGCSFPVVNGIARFVDSDNYADAFGRQWNHYRTTQLDSHTGASISRDRLTRLLGGALSIVDGKRVLEAGCGAGRFSEILLASGAHLNAVDLSSAVEANHKNCSHFSNYSVSQASILALPFAPEKFDVVICVGVIQHTPNPEQTIEALCRQVRPGGLLVIDHYSHEYPVTLSRRFFRALLLRLPKRAALPFCAALTTVFWPIHRLCWSLRHARIFRRLRTLWLHVSPLVDYHDPYPQLSPEQLKAWATLDTHDTLTDHFKHLRSAEQIRECLDGCGMEDVETSYAGNGVEARARKAARSEMGPVPELAG